VRAWLEPRGPASFNDIFKRRKWLVFRVREREFVARCGLDAYMSLRGVQLMGNITLGMAVLVAAFLLPAYKVQPRSQFCVDWCVGRHHDHADLPQPRGQDPSECLCASTDRFALGNVPSGSQALWLPVLGMAVTSALVIWLLTVEYKEVVRIRASYWMSMPPEMFTILIDDIPAHLGIHTIASLRDHLEQVFPNDVLRVDPVRFHDESVLNQLRRTGRQRMAVHDKLTRLLAFKERFGEIPSCHSVCLNRCVVGNLDDAIVNLEARYHKLNRTFEELFYGYRKLESEDQAGRIARSVTSCFVTFRSAKTAAVAAQSVMHHSYNVVSEPAAEPDDVIWDSLGAGVASRACSKYSARAAMTVLVLFWGVLTTAVTALTSIPFLERQIPELKRFFDEVPAFEDLLQQLAPLLLSALVSVVNPIVCLLARVEARASEGAADHLATTWYFTFLVLQVFIFAGASNVVYSTMQEILHSPSLVLDKLARMIPQNASFYMQFLLSKFVTSLCFDLFRLSDLFVHWIRRLVFGRALTHRDRRIAACGCNILSNPAPRNLSALNGQLLLLFFIVMSYAIIQPLIVPLGFVFFYMAYFVYAKLFMACNVQRFDSAGTLWPSTFYCFVSALLTAQLTLSGYLGLKKGYTQSTVLLLVFLASAFTCAQVDFHYRKLVLNIPLDVAAAVDRKICVSDDAVEVPASVWQYGMLTGEDPNFFGRQLADRPSRSHVEHLPDPEAHIVPERLQVPEGDAQVVGDAVDTTNDDSELTGTDDIGMASGSFRRRPRHQSGGGSSFGHPQAATVLPYYSYELPILREPPVLDIPELAGNTAEAYPVEVFRESTEDALDDQSSGLVEPLIAAPDDQHLLLQEQQQDQEQQGAGTRTLL
ncbi:CSC1-like protein ERD4 (Hyperosmolality-gated Ca2+ permeable channel 3.1) (AtOSCA3.1) (Protein EARLY-RESPONSIVE TO DEHYDRATION STRESS 4), partial [Durusdinium trenchii]